VWSGTFLLHEFVKGAHLILSATPFMGSNPPFPLWEILVNRPAANQLKWSDFPEIPHKSVGQSKHRNKRTILRFLKSHKLPEFAGDRGHGPHHVQGSRPESGSPQILPKNLEILCVAMLGRLSPHLAGPWAAGCAYSFGFAPSATVRSQPQCRGVLLCAQARHHRTRRRCLNSWPPRISPAHGRLCKEGARPRL
jgi:hypothetical protein